MHWVERTCWHASSWRDFTVAIRDASRRGRLRWERSSEPNDREEYPAEVDGAGGVVVELLRPVDQEGRVLGAMAVRVNGPGISATVAAGTEEMELIREGLAVSLPDWAATIAAESEALEAECRFLLELAVPQGIDASDETESMRRRFKAEFQRALECWYVRPRVNERRRDLRRERMREGYGG